VVISYPHGPGCSPAMNAATEAWSAVASSGAQAAGAAAAAAGAALQGLGGTGDAGLAASEDEVRGALAEESRLLAEATAVLLQSMRHGGRNPATVGVLSRSIAQQALRRLERERGGGLSRAKVLHAVRRDEGLRRLLGLPMPTRAWQEGGSPVVQHELERHAQELLLSGDVSALLSTAEFEAFIAELVQVDVLVAAAASPSLGTSYDPFCSAYPNQGASYEPYDAGDAAGSSAAARAGASRQLFQQREDAVSAQLAAAEAARLALASPLAVALEAVASPLAATGASRPNSAEKVAAAVATWEAATAARQAAFFQAASPTSQEGPLCTGASAATRAVPPPPPPPPPPQQLHPLLAARVVAEVERPAGASADEVELLRLRLEEVERGVAEEEMAAPKGGAARKKAGRAAAARRKLEAEQQQQQEGATRRREEQEQLEAFRRQQLTSARERHEEKHAERGGSPPPTVKALPSSPTGPTHRDDEGGKLAGQELADQTSEAQYARPQSFEG